MNPGLNDQAANKRPPMFLVIMLTLLLIVTSGYLAYTQYTSLKKIHAIQSNQDKLALKSVDIKNAYTKLQKEFKDLETAYGAVVSDRQNLINQAKNIISEKNRAQELEGELARAKSEIEAFKGEKEKLSAENFSFRQTIKHLESIRAKTLSEKEELMNMLAAERDQSAARQLMLEKARLEKENADMAGLLKQAQAEVLKIKDNTTRFKDDSNKAESNLKMALVKSENARKDMKKELDNLNSAYTLAVRKNSDLQQKIVDLPRKFAEIAGQNKTLIRQTANMHYNLGVFYVEHKEYTRAIVEFEKAIELTPDDAYAHFNAGYIYAEYLVDRPKAIEQFRHYLRLSKKDDKDVDFARRYILTWQTITGREPMD